MLTKFEKVMLFVCVFIICLKKVYFIISTPVIVLSSIIFFHEILISKFAYFSSMNFGALGSLIGHEITHAFDVQGNKLH